jgi:hypothetical protein
VVHEEKELHKALTKLVWLVSGNVNHTATSSLLILGVHAGSRLRIKPAETRYLVPETLQSVLGRPKSWSAFQTLGRDNASRFPTPSTLLTNNVRANCGRVLGLLEKMVTRTSGGKYQTEIDVLRPLFKCSLKGGNLDESCWNRSLEHSRPSRQPGPAANMGRMCTVAPTRAR